MINERQYQAVHVEDNLSWLDSVRFSLEQYHLAKVHPARTLYDFHRINTVVPGYEADLFILDRHFPEAPGKPIGDNWKSVAEFLEKMVPQAPILILTSVALPDKVWRRHKNIVDFQLKQNFDSDRFRDKVAQCIRERVN